MLTFIAHVRRLLLKDRVYGYMLLSVVIFYLLAIFFQRMLPPQTSQMRPAVKTHTEIITKSELTSADMWSERLAKHPEAARNLQYFILFTYGLLIAGIVFGAISLNRLIHREELVPRVKRPPNITWGVADVARLIIVFVWFGIVLNLILLALRVLVLKATPSWFLLLHTFAINSVAVYFIYWLVKESGGRIRDLLGFDWPRISIREIGYGLATYIGMLPALFVILVAVVYVTGLFSYEPPAHPLVNVFEIEGKKDPLLLGFSIFLACFLGPVIEEIFFRGFLYPAVKKSWGIRPAFLLSAALFAAVHQNLFAFVPIFFLGVLLAYLYEKRRSVLPCIALHIAHNCLFVAYFFLAKSLMS